VLEVPLFQGGKPKYGSQDRLVNVFAVLTAAQPQVQSPFGHGLQLVAVLLAELFGA